MTNSALSSTPRRELTEDWLAVWVGLLIFTLALAGLAGRDLLGWAVSTSVWTDFSTALKATSNVYTGLGGFGALIATYGALLVVLTIGVAALKGKWSYARSAGFPPRHGRDAVGHGVPGSQIGCCCRSGDLASF